MKPGAPPDWLRASVAAVRALMITRLRSGSLDAQAQHEIESALQELDGMWEELQRQAALLARDSERYAGFFEHVPDAYLITDPGGGVREANRAALALLKVACEDIVGRPLGEFLAAGFSGHAIPLRKNARGWLIRPAGA